MTDHNTSATRRRLAEYLYTQAGWRDLNAEENPADDRNRRSADGLRALASHVEGLPEDDERLYVLAALDANPSEPFRPGREAERLTRRYMFELRNESPDAWFDRFIDAVSRGRGEEENGEERT